MEEVIRYFENLEARIAEQAQRLAEQEERIAEQKERIASQAERIAALEAKVEELANRPEPEPQVVEKIVEVEKPVEVIKEVIVEKPIIVAPPVVAPEPAQAEPEMPETPEIQEAPQPAPELITEEPEPELITEEAEPVAEEPEAEPAPAPEPEKETVQETVSPNAALYGKAVTDIRQAISLGDRFLYQRELFGQNAELMQRTLTELNGLGSFDEAMSYISRFNWDQESNSYQQFLVTLHRRFG